MELIVSIMRIMGIKTTRNSDCALRNRGLSLLPSHIYTVSNAMHGVQIVNNKNE